MSVTHALERYQANYRAEKEAALLYQEQFVIRVRYQS
jgi:hypothetical protein